MFFLLIKVSPQFLGNLSLCAPFFCLKEGVESMTLLNLIYSEYQGFERGNSLYYKLWTHLDKRAKHALRSTNEVLTKQKKFPPGDGGGAQI